MNKKEERQERRPKIANLSFFGKEIVGDKKPRILGGVLSWLFLWPPFSAGPKRN